MVVLRCHPSSTAGTLKLEADKLSDQEQWKNNCKGLTTLGGRHEVAAKGEDLVGEERGINGPLLGIDREARDQEASWIKGPAVLTTALLDPVCIFTCAIYLVSSLQFT